MWSISQLLRYTVVFFFFNDTATTEIYTLSLHDALPIYGVQPLRAGDELLAREVRLGDRDLLPREHQGTVHLRGAPTGCRSEEHTSELQSRQYLVCRLLLEKKRINSRNSTT